MSKTYQASNPCTVDGCKGAVFGRGLCSTHYQRKRRTGTTDARVSIKTLPCQVEACGEYQYSDGLCRRHYRAKRRHGDPTVRILEDITGLICEICGCEEPVRAKRLCTNHYANFRYVKSTGLAETIPDYIRMRNGAEH